MTQPDDDARRLPGAYTVQLPVERMNCAACVARVEKALHGGCRAWTSAAVNLATERAQVTYNPHRTSTGALVTAIRDAGYGVTGTTATFPVLGMDCASCATRVGRVVQRVCRE